LVPVHPIDLGLLVLFVANRTPSLFPILLRRIQLSAESWTLEEFEEKLEADYQIGEDLKEKVC
jgi:hypothetical protein